MKNSELATTQKENDFIKHVIPNIKPTTSIKLLYRGSRDGWKPFDFHRLCDNQGPTVSLIKSTSGRLAGGFTSVSWTSQSQWQNDAKALVFSVDSEVKFPCL